MICPTCKRNFNRPGEPGRPPLGPFCSERCRSADLGNWLDGNYRIPNTAGGDEDEDGLEAAARSDDASGDAVN